MKRRQVLRSIGAATGGLAFVGSASAKGTDKKSIDFDFNPKKHRETKRFVVSCFESADDMSSSELSDTEEEARDRLSNKQEKAIAEFIEEGTERSTKIEHNLKRDKPDDSDEGAITPDAAPKQSGSFDYTVSTEIKIQGHGLFDAYDYTHKLNWNYTPGQSVSGAYASTNANTHSYVVVTWKYNGDADKNITYRDRYVRSYRKGKITQSFPGGSFKQHNYPLIVLTGDNNGYGNAPRIRNK